MQEKLKLDFKKPVNEEEFLKYLKEDSLDDIKHISKKQINDKFVITKDPKMIEIMETIKKTANSKSHVLISGENSVGKKQIAKSIHHHSEKKNKPLIILDCSSTSDYDDIFNKNISIENSNYVLILDNIDQINIETQSKILNIIKDDKFKNLKIIAITEKDITKQIEKGNFIKELYYRLYAIHFEIPPLRHRPKDIKCLSNHFLNKLSKEFKKDYLTISQKALAKMINYNWPGNIIELENVMKRAIIACGQEMIIEDHIQIKQNIIKNNLWIENLPIGEHLKTVEKHFILQTLKHYKGNRTHSAKTLGISLRTLRNKINDYQNQGLEVTPFKSRPLNANI